MALSGIEWDGSEVVWIVWVVDFGFFCGQEEDFVGLEEERAEGSGVLKL